MDRQCSSCGGFCKKSGCERENVTPEQSIETLRQQLADEQRQSDSLRVQLDNCICSNIEIDKEREILVDAIQQTLDENGWLADGDCCTLILLKKVLAKVGAAKTGEEE